MTTTQKRTVRSLDLPHAEVYAYRKSVYGAVGDVARLPEGDSVSVGNLESHDSTLLDETETDPSRLFISPRGFTWGDYVGSTAERSNYNVFLDRHGDKDGVYRTYGGYGSHGILIRADVTDEQVLEDLQAVAEYPLLDEMDFSDLEFALEQFALGDGPIRYDDKDGIGGWHGDALDDFRTALEHRIIDAYESQPELRDRARTAFDIPNDEDPDNVVGAVLDALDDFPDDALRDIFWDHAERGMDILHETATGPYVDAEAVASKVDPSFVLP